MTRTTNARLAGFTFLFYIAIGIAGVILFNQATKGDETAARLASIAAHAPLMRLSLVCTLLTIFSALILAVTLYALTRGEDPDLALLALTCRVSEGVINAVCAIAMLALLWVATRAGTTATAPDAATANALGASLLKVQGWSTTVGATAFAVGSTLYSYLFLRARSIPVWLAWLGVLGSILLIVTVPLEGLQVIKGPVVGFIWLPMLVLKVVLGLWLLIKGATMQPVAVTAAAPT